MAAVVLASGSLIPAMILHAVIDAGGGSVGYLLLRDYPPVDDVSSAGSIDRAQDPAPSTSQ